MAKLTWKDLENAGRKIGSEVGNAARKVNTVMTGTRAASTGASNYAGQKSSVKQAPRARMKKYSNPMEVRQYGPTSVTKLDRNETKSSTAKAEQLSIQNRKVSNSFRSVPFSTNNLNRTIENNRKTVQKAAQRQASATGSMNSGKATAGETERKTTAARIISAGAKASVQGAKPVAKQAVETARKSRPASERFAEISQRAAARRSDETNAAIEKNQRKNEWRVSKMNSSGSYKAMMQQRTRAAMQKASQKNLANRPTSSIPSRQSQDIDSYRQEYERLTRQTVRGNAQQRDKATKARKAYEEAFKRDHPDIDFETIRGKKKGR